ncbi:VaFE repeat-containing surface-anchored protein, partial [Corynebacterium sp.]|uniref:VaFE repeat-containing surface-anchored protein n=1 Tax=Corynebacterium sp. TaxID=1720 RepID=UPI0026DD5038
MHNHRRGSAVITGGGESRARVVYAIIGAMALLLGVARFAPSDMAPTAYGASDIGDPSASATGKVDPKAVGELAAPGNGKGNGASFHVKYPHGYQGKPLTRQPENNIVVDGNIRAACVDTFGGPAGESRGNTVAPDNSIRGTQTFNPELGKKFAARWADVYESQDFASVAKAAGVPNADSRALESGVAMAGWALEGRDIDEASVVRHIPRVPGNIGDRELPTETEQARQIAHYMINEAQNYSGKTEESAEPATVKISQGDRTENGDGTVIPISVSGSSDNDKATIKVEGLPSGAKLTDANGKTVNDGDEVAVPSELKLTIPSGTDPGQAKISATTTKTSKLPAGTLLKPNDDNAQWIMTMKPGKDVPSNATAGINVKWDKETPSSSSSSSSSATSSTSASSSAPKPVVPTSSDSATSSTSSRVTSPSSTSSSESSTTSSEKPSSTASESSSTSASSSSTPVIPANDNPKISTTVDVDGKKSAEGNPVKVDASKLHEGINVKDHIDYEGLAPNTKYEFTGTLMKVENGKATPVSGVKPASKVETIGKDGKGTATVDFGKITDLKPDTQYVVFEKAVPLDKSENPSVDDNGTPKNPSEDKRETVTHEDADDDSQTFISGGESSSSTTPAPSSTSSTSSSSVKPSSTSSESTSKPVPAEIKESESSTTSKPSSTASESSSTSASSSTKVPANDNPKISTTVDVDGKKSAEGNPVKVDASKLHDGINVKDHIDYEGFAPNTKYEFTGTLMKVENGKATPVSGVKPASKVETIGKDGKGTATVDFGKITDLKPDTQYVVFEKAVPLDKSENPSVDDNGTPKNPSE